MKNDNRIDLIKIPNGLKDALNNAGFTVESILNNEPSKIAQDLGIEEYVGKIIFEETKKEFADKRFAEIVSI
ncbi:MAG: hypothetical protein ACE5SW_08720 [Nitrososphaeraceae archaeon]